MRTLPVLLALLTLGACGTEPPVVPAWRGEGNLVEVTVHEIHCAGCEQAVEDAIALAAGVDAVTADHVTKLVLVTLEAEADRDAAIASIRDAIHEAGRKVVGEDEIE